MARLRCSCVGGGQPENVGLGSALAELVHAPPEPVHLCARVRACGVLGAERFWLANVYLLLGYTRMALQA